MVAHHCLFALSKEGGRLNVRVEDANARPPAAAREIDIRGDTILPPVLNILKPTEITTVKELWQVAGSEKLWFDKINGQVDFDKERLLLFAWKGSSGDKFWFTVSEPKGARLVTFHRWHGEEDDEHQQVRLFAVDKTADWAFKEDKNP